MKRHVSIVMCFIFVLIGFFIFAQNPRERAKLKHCISAKYEAVWGPMSVYCANRHSYNFEWTIHQEADCGKKIWGKITERTDSPTGNRVFYYTGEIQFLNPDCCIIRGQLKSTVGEFNATLCRNQTKPNGKVVKWGSTSGRLTSNIDELCPNHSASLQLYYKSPLVFSRRYKKRIN